MDFSGDPLDYTQEREKKSRTLKTLYGIAVVIGIAVSWAGLTQFAKSTYTNSFDAPSFVVWFSTSWLSLCFPVILLTQRIMNGWGLLAIYDKAQSVFGDRGICPYTLLTRCMPFALLWVGNNYLFTRSLAVLSPTDVTALYSSTPAFVFLLSLLLLRHESFSWRRLLATLISIGGITVIAYSNGFTGPTTAGVLLVVGAAILAATFRVTFKLFAEDANITQVSLFSTCIGLLNLLCFWPIIEILHFTHYEKIDWYHMPWSYLCGFAALALMFNFLITFGTALTFPLFISLGTGLGIPLNAAVDAIWRSAPFTWSKGIGTVMIIVGFILISVRSKHKKEEEEDISATPLMSSAGFIHNTSQKLLGSSQPILE